MGAFKNHRFEHFLGSVGKAHTTQKTTNSRVFKDALIKYVQYYPCLIFLDFPWIPFR